MNQRRGSFFACTFCALLVTATRVPGAGVIALRPDDVTTMVGERGALHGGLKADIAVAGFASPRDTITWTVSAPQDDDYAVSLIFSTPRSALIEVRSGDAVLSAASLPKTWPDRPFYWRQELPGTLRLKAGENNIVLRLPEATADRTVPSVTPRRSAKATRPPPPGSQPTDEFSLWSIELGTPAARRAQLTRAREIRGDASWMVAGKYGLFVHWSPLAYAFANDYPLDPPWERWARAIKAGNPDAVVGFSSQRGPTVSPFSELAVTDGGGALGQPDLALIGPGGQLGEVTPTWWLAMDSWINKAPMHGTISPGPRYPMKDYVNYFQRMTAAGFPVTINLVITADVTREHPIFNPPCVAVMDEVRKTIRGK